MYNAPHPSLTPKISATKPGMAAHAFNPSNRKQRQADLREFKASLIYIVVSGEQGLQGNSVSDKNKTNKQNPNSVTILCLSRWSQPMITQKMSVVLNGKARRNKLRG